MSTKTCYVYLIAHKNAAGNLDGPIKVGISTDMTGRLASIQTGNPRSIAIAAYFTTPNTTIARELERAFHEVYAGKRLSGEWFDIDPLVGLVGLTANVEAALRYFLEDDPAALADALKWSGVDKAHLRLEKIRALGQSDGVKKYDA